MPATRARSRFSGIATAAIAASGGFSLAAPAQPTGQPTPDLADAVPAPPGTISGSPIISLLGRATVTEVSSARQLPLEERPDAATHLRITVTPLGPGSLAWATGPSGNGPSASWDEADVAAGSTAWQDLPLDDQTRTLSLTPSEGARALVTLQYVVHVPTLLGVNAAGETFGVEGAGGTPDLIALEGVAPDGSPVAGYSRREDLFAFSPDDPEGPRRPEDAAREQAERDRAYPGSWDIPVYESDGRTRVGTFRVG